MDKKSDSKTITLVLIIFAFTYAVLRYHILRGVSWEHFPLYIFNKAISLSAVFLIGASYLLGSLSRYFPQIFSRWLDARKLLGVSGFVLAAAHAFISLLIFNQGYYPRFFAEDGKLTLNGELSMLFGVLAFFIFTMVSITSIPSVEKTMNKEDWLRVQRKGYLAFPLVGLHVLVMGYGGWLNAKDWPGGMLPISLVAFIVIMATLLMRIIALLFPVKRS